MPSADLIDAFIEIVGEKNALRQGEDVSRYTHENRNIFVGSTPLVLKPASTDEVRRIMRLAAETKTAIVPQGGHTGHVGGAAPDESGSQIVVSLERMNAIVEIDDTGDTATVEAGVILADIQEAAAEANRLFPLSLGSQGSCQIGGNISTNAGGTGVLAYGNMRELVLGLEVVLPNGEVWNGLRKLTKDNTGYAMKHLFIGAEGTLGIVTRATLRLFPMPRGRQIAWIGVQSPSAALELFNRFRSAASRMLTAFELIHRTPLEFLLAHAEWARDPFADRHEWYVLAEISSGRSEEDAQSLMEETLLGALERQVVEDAVLAQSLTQRRDFWRMREDMSEAQKPEGASIKHDISVPVHRIPEFIERGGAILSREMPDARPYIFGHMGDGNLHYNISQPNGGDAAAFLADRERINALIHELVLSMEGSIAAEHGVGRLKRDMLAHSKDPVELDLMRRVKHALDPDGIMNPGKII